MAELTPIRKWIQNDLAPITINGVWSDNNGVIFYQMTGVTHNQLLQKWYQFKDRKPDYNTIGPEPKFTTCTSFLPIFASRIYSAGKLPGRRFRPFLMDQEKGWVPVSSIANDNGPKEGDFFLTNNNKGQRYHVGVIIQIQGNMWSTVSGGAGGRNARRDGVKRSQLGPRPDYLVGWLDVDLHFEGWAS